MTKEMLRGHSDMPREKEGMSSRHQSNLERLLLNPLPRGQALP